MTAKTSNKSSSGPRLLQDDKRETAKSWLARHLRRPMLRQSEVENGKLETICRYSLERPQTAPSTANARPPNGLPVVLDYSLTRPLNKPPSRPPRPDSSMMRDVSAWLDTNTNMSKPPPPLMGGVSYWKEGAFTGSEASAHVQYAIPIVRRPDAEQPSTSHGQQLKSFCRRAKKMQVRMPSLLRTRSQRTAVRKQVNRRSSSMPLFAIPYEDVREGEAPVFVTRSKSLTSSALRPATATTSAHAEAWHEPAPFLVQSLRHGSPTSARFVDSESSTERRIPTMFSQTVRAGYSIRPATAGTHFPREDSMGNLSDAPTYFSGLPPPSYRSRAASILTTSSFGCIDGMNPEQRQLSQQRAAQRNRGVKGKFRKFAQRALSK